MRLLTHSVLSVKTFDLFMEVEDFNPPFLQYSSNSWKCLWKFTKHYKFEKRISDFIVNLKKKSRWILICSFPLPPSQVGASFGDPSNPCVSYFCHSTGFVAVVQDCPKQTWCAEVSHLLKQWSTKFTSHVKYKRNLSSSLFGKVCAWTIVIHLL